MQLNKHNITHRMYNRKLHQQQVYRRKKEVITILIWGTPGLYQEKNLEVATNAHFNLPGHSIVNIKISLKGTTECRKGQHWLGLQELHTI